MLQAAGAVLVMRYRVRENSFMQTSALLLLLMAAAFVSLWIPERQPRKVFAFGLLGSAAFPAIALGALTFLGLVWVMLLFATGRYYDHPAIAARRVARPLFLGLVLALGFGLLPGFGAEVLFDSQILKEGSAEYLLRIRPDKVIAGFALLTFALPLSHDPAGWGRIAVATLRALAVTAPLVMGAGWLSGYVGLAAQQPNLSFVATWAVTNLLFVAGLEEGFFRGVIQRGLTKRLGTVGAGGLAAVLFGLAHFAGGGVYVLLATLAGLGYGLAYHLSGQRIEAAILTHFGVNLLHLLLFTYPYALR